MLIKFEEITRSKKGSMERENSGSKYLTEKEDRIQRKKIKFSKIKVTETTWKYPPMIIIRNMQKNEKNINISDGGYWKDTPSKNK